MLSRMWDAVRDAAPGAAFQIIDHFNKSGHGTDLDRFAQAGMSAFADSWWGIEHGEPPDLDAGLFKLRAEVGSPHWGGCAYDVDVDEGSFDLDDGYSTPLKLQVTRVGQRGPRAGRSASDHQISSAASRL